MLSTRIDSIRTAGPRPLLEPLPAPPPPARFAAAAADADVATTFPPSDLRATLSFPQSRRDNQYAKSNPVQHGRFAVMQNGPEHAGAFDSRRGIPSRRGRRGSPRERVRTRAYIKLHCYRRSFGKPREMSDLSFRARNRRPRPLSDAHKLRSFGSPLRSTPYVANTNVAVYAMLAIRPGNSCERIIMESS